MTGGPITVRAPSVSLRRYDAVGDFGVLWDMAMEYWKELMPFAAIWRTEESVGDYFSSRFGEASGNTVYLAVSRKVVGFLAFTETTQEKFAAIDDFFVMPAFRRRGIGTQMLQALLAELDSRGVEQIDLNVRRDNPDALAFWEKQGFGIASYRMRQYRDPASHTAYVGSLSSDFVDNGQT